MRGAGVVDRDAHDPHDRDRRKSEQHGDVAALVAMESKWEPEHAPLFQEDFNNGLGDALNELLRRAYTPAGGHFILRAE